MIRQLVAVLGAAAMFGCASASNINGAASADLAPRELHGVDKAAVYAQATKAVHALHWTTKGGTAENGLIQATTGVSLGSYGEDVLVTVTTPAPDTVKVFVSSQAHGGMDFGKDEGNLRAFYAEFDKDMAEASAAARQGKPEATPASAPAK